MSLSRWNIPFLVKYDKEAHAIGGAIIGLFWVWILGDHLPRTGVLGIAVGMAIAAGSFKEFALDLHADLRDIPPWGWGAATACAVWMACHGQ
jgi:hypothetical protein